jgi:hypothetical protein
MSLFRNNSSERRRSLRENGTRLDRPRLPVISALLGMLAMLNIASAVMTLIR